MIAMTEHTLDDTDIRIISILLEDSRTSYRSIGGSVNLTTNAVKNRVRKLIAHGVILGFTAAVSPRVFGFSRVCHVVVKDTRNQEATLGRLKLFGQIITMMECVGGVTTFEIGVSGDRTDEDLQSVRTVLMPAEVLSITSAPASPVRERLNATDLRIMKRMISDPTMRIVDLAREVRVSSKTAGERLGRMKEARILRFSVDLDRSRMKGYVRFLMIMRLDGKESPRTVSDIHEEIRKSFLACSPFFHEKGFIKCVPLARSIYDIDPYLKKVEALDGVIGAEVYLPSRIVTDKTWMLREIEKRIDPRTAVSVVRR